MLNILKKDNKVESLDVKKIKNVLSWANEPKEKTKWYKIKAKWNKFWKKKNKYNPFDIEIDTDAFADALGKMLNTTPEEEAERHKRTIEMLEYMMHPYNKTQIEENVFKYTHNNKPEDFYYKVNEIKMSPEEYQHYLDKKVLNEKLSKNLQVRAKTKQGKI